MNTDRAQLAAIEKAVTDTADQITRLQAAHDARVTELLKANNALLERARLAEARLRELEAEIYRSIVNRKAPFAGTTIMIFSAEAARRLTAEFVAQAAPNDVEG